MTRGHGPHIAPAGMVSIACRDRQSAAHLGIGVPTGCSTSAPQAPWETRRSWIRQPVTGLAFLDITVLVRLQRQKSAQQGRSVSSVVCRARPNAKHAPLATGATQANGSHAPKVTTQPVMCRQARGWIWTPASLARSIQRRKGGTVPPSVLACVTHTFILILLN